MTVRFTKSRHAERPHTMTCIRDDGTTTGQASTPFFISHDLTHFAVEKTFGFQQAFYGLISQGWDFDSFEERELGTRKVRDPGPEAVAAEYLVGAIDVGDEALWSASRELRRGIG